MSAVAAPAAALATSLRRRRVALAAYGVVLALFAVAYWDGRLGPTQLQMQGSRVSLLQNSVAVLDAGGPPLLGSSVPYSEGLKSPAADFYSVNGGDDEGVYLYVPVAAHATGQTDVITVGKWLSILGLATIPLLYPLIMFALFESLLAAILVPLAATVMLRSFVTADIYWVAAWVILLGMPLVYLAARKRASWWPRPALLAAAALAASFANSMRAHSGTGVAIAALAVAVAAPATWRQRLGSAAAVVIAFVAISPVAFTAVRAYRDHVSHLPPPVLPTAHPLWHPTYLGLGYLPNRWGVRWNDAVGMQAAQRVDPKVVYLSPHYESILRGLYFDAWEQAPGWVAHLYLVKAAVLVRAGWDRFWPALLVLAPLLLARGTWPGRLRRWTLLLLPALVLAAVPAVLTEPLGYAKGFYGALALLALLVLGIAARAAAPYLERARNVQYYRLLEEQPATETTAEVSAVARVEASRLWNARPERRRVVAAATGALALAAVAGAADALASRNDRAASYYLSETPAASVPQHSRRVVQWAPAVLARWEPQDGATATAGPGGATVVTGATGSVAALTSQSFELPAGRYAIHTRGAVVSGGLVIEPLDEGTGNALALGYFWDGQRGLDRRGMLVPFELSSSTHVRVELVNWRDVPGSSTWRLQRVVLVRLPR